MHFLYVSLWWSSSDPLCLIYFGYIISVNCCWMKVRSKVINFDNHHFTSLKNVWCFPQTEKKLTTSWFMQSGHLANPFFILPMYLLHLCLPTVRTLFKHNTRLNISPIIYEVGGNDIWPFFCCSFFYRTRASSSFKIYLIFFTELKLSFINMKDML